MSQRLLAVLAHPDDESLGFGGVLARYAAQGVETHLITATRGQGGRFFGHAANTPPHPGREELGRIRQSELEAAVRALGIRELTLLDYEDQLLDRADVHIVVARIATEIRRCRPDVVVTFPPDGIYGHPDHIAISQFATAACVAASDPLFPGITGAPHRIAKLYYRVWNEAEWRAYTAAFRSLGVMVDGERRDGTWWPDWAITTRVDTREWWRVVWNAVSSHQSQVSAYEGLKALTEEHQSALWGAQTFYRAYSLVNGGRVRETDLFEGIARTDDAIQRQEPQS